MADRDPSPAPAPAPAPAPPPPLGAAPAAAPKRAPGDLFGGKPSVVRGMLFLLASNLAGATMTAMMRLLADELPIFELTFFRITLGFAVLIPLFVPMGLAVMRTRNPWLQATRGLLNGLGMVAAFYAVTLVPLAKLAALHFTMPLFAAVLALLMLKEKIRARRITALAIGYAGVLIVLQPDGSGGWFDLGSLLALFASAIFGYLIIVVRVLSRTDSSLTITFYLYVFAAPVALAFAIPVWVWPTLEQWAWLIAIGVMGSIVQIGFVQAFKEAEVTAITPINFSQLIWSAFYGYVLFAEVPTLWTWVGGAVIFSATTYIAYREAQASRRERAAAAG